MIYFQTNHIKMGCLSKVWYKIRETFSMVDTIYYCIFSIDYIRKRLFAGLIWQIVTYLLV